jgi:hypothetical protein
METKKNANKKERNSKMIENPSGGDSISFDKKIQRYETNESEIFSPVWIWFQKVPKSTNNGVAAAKCLVCKNIIKRNQCSTNNLEFHIVRKHGPDSAYNIKEICVRLQAIREERITKKRKEVGLLPKNLTCPWDTDTKKTTYKKEKERKALRYAELKESTFFEKIWDNDSLKVKSDETPDFSKRMEEFQQTWNFKCAIGYRSSPVWVWYSCKSRPSLEATCLICDTVVGLTSRSLISHLSDNHSFKSSYDAYSEMLRLRDLQSPDKKVSCSICQEALLSNADHYKHILDRHTVDGTIICNCGNKIKSPSRLSVHKKTGCTKSNAILHHQQTIANRKFGCQYCTDRFATAKSHARHVNRFHTGPYHYCCKYCGKGFHKQSECQQHEITHTDEKPFECKDCHKRFNAKHLVTQHKKYLSCIRRQKELQKRRT